jgi:hypothetical protein
MNNGWFKATASSDNSHCVKVRSDGSDVLLGDTKNDHLGDREPVIRIPGAQWRGVLAALAAMSS